MSTFHSTMSRREFMKTLGLTGAALGAFGAGAPVFHDLDEVISSEKSIRSLPWYVKEQDKPTFDIDWAQVQRYDAANTDCFGLMPDSERPAFIEKRAKLTKDLVSKNVPGNTLRDVSLWQSVNFAAHNLRPWYPTEWPVAPPPFFTPEELGVPKWNDTPENNLAMMRSVVRFFGGSDVTALKFDQNTRKLVFRRTGGLGIFGDSPIVHFEFEDVDTPYETPAKKVIPNVYDNVLTWALVQSATLDQRLDPENNTALSATSFFHAYYRISTMFNHLQRFLHGIGYGGIGGEILPADSGVCSFAFLNGMGENCRASYSCHPVYGTMVRVPNRLYTNLPLAQTKPIDAGIHRFCLDCGRCAEICPSGAISKQEPSWEVHGIWNAGGYKAWRVDYGKCYPFRGFPGGETVADCGMCQASCVFAKGNQAMVHDLVKVTVATTPVFNGFFAKMDKAFGYPSKDVEGWWTEESPVYGIDSQL